MSLGWVRARGRGSGRQGRVRQGGEGGGSCRHHAAVAGYSLRYALLSNRLAPAGAQGHSTPCSVSKGT